MLTKKLLLLPALLGCTLLTANADPKTGCAVQGNQMTFKGNSFTWRETDTISYNQKTGYAEHVPVTAKTKPQLIVSMNNEPVHRNDFLQTQASYGKTEDAFVDYIIQEFRMARSTTADSNTYLTDLSLVIDKEGKIVYFDARFGRDENPIKQQKFWSTLNDPDKEPNMMIEKIITKAPLWKPATIDGKPVNSFVRVSIPGC
jgi:hypothetical protein